MNSKMLWKILKTPFDKSMCVIPTGVDSKFQIQNYFIILNEKRENNTKQLGTNRPKGDRYPRTTGTDTRMQTEFPFQHQQHYNVHETLVFNLLGQKKEVQTIDGCRVCHLKCVLKGTGAFFPILFFCFLHCIFPYIWNSLVSFYPIKCIHI